MKKKQITQKEAKEKYGIVISKMQKLDRTKFYLLSNGSVVDSLGDTRYEKPMCYGDYQSKSDKWLDKRADSIMKELEKYISPMSMKLIEELLEVERELTLREEDPR